MDTKVEKFTQIPGIKFCTAFIACYAVLTGKPSTSLIVTIFKSDQFFDMPIINTAWTDCTGKLRMNYIIHQTIPFKHIYFADISAKLETEDLIAEHLKSISPQISGSYK